jgi:signal transduction histidine kinase
MSERVRLLGGKLEIDSKPGGPTRVFARIPRWQPLTSA